MAKTKNPKWSYRVSTIARGMFEVLLDGTKSGKCTISIVMPQRDWFVRVRGLTTSDYAILRATRLLRYDRNTKTFTISDPLVIGKLARMGVKPKLIRTNVPQLVE